MSEINFNMLNRFLDLKNLCVATKIICLAHILKKILGILSFGGHLECHLEYFNFPSDAKFLCTDILENTFMQKHFVRTIFWGCTTVGRTSD